MHITLECDYAVRIVLCIANNKGRMFAKDISETTGVSLRFSLKILRKLVSGGIVKSFKGLQGGYELAMKPEEISLYDIVEVAEGTYVFSRCLDSDYKCTKQHEGECAPRKVYAEISEIVTQKLKDAKISELICKA